MAGNSAGSPHDGGSHPVCHRSPPKVNGHSGKLRRQTLLPDASEPAFMRRAGPDSALSDREDATKGLARCRLPLLTAIDADRFGYVPNVVYACGALKVGETLPVPYGISDKVVGFATTTINEIL